MKKIVNLTEMSEYIGINKRTLYRMIKDKRFPVESIKGANPRLWNIEEIDAWRKNNDIEKIKSIILSHKPENLATCKIPMNNGFRLVIKNGVVVTIEPT